MLAEIDAGRAGDEHPVANRVFHSIQNRRALYVALFLHDIAKGRPEDHSVAGAAIARKLGPRFGLDAAETDTAAWLVEHHLLMSITSVNSSAVVIVCGSIVPTMPNRSWAQPLEGIVETDWLPATFTMNWRLTRPNYPVHFEAGDPICMVVPVPRGLAESLVPVAREHRRVQVVDQADELFVLLIDLWNVDAVIIAPEKDRCRHAGTIGGPPRAL